MLKILRVSLSKNQLELGNEELKVAGSVSPPGVGERVLWEKDRSKARKLLTNFDLIFSWLFVIGCLQHFNFATLRLLQAQILVSLQRSPQHQSYICLMVSLFNFNLTRPTKISCLYAIYLTRNLVYLFAKSYNPINIRIINAMEDYHSITVIYSLRCSHALQYM